MTLPAAFAPLADRRQFVTYRLDPDPDTPGKTHKRPTHWQTGIVCDAQNPANQTSYAEAFATGRAVGYVFRADDPYFFVDIDHCFDGVNWTPIALDYMARFRGAGFEMSQSKTGIHIIGRGTCPEHACKNISLGLELYTGGRFVALTGLLASGSVDFDCTAQLAVIVPAHFPLLTGGRDVVGWGDEPVEGYGGPEDDAELFKMMMAAGRKNPDKVFGDEPTFSDLYHRNVDKLAKKWPGNNDGGYDGSSVDQSFFNHLAFWTGKNPERMRRLGVDSDLWREKWERDDYLEGTILKACAYTTNIFTRKPAPQPPGLGPDSPASATGSDGAEERCLQRELTRHIGEGSDAVPCTTVFTLAEMLSRFVFIKEGSLVADKLRPQVVLPFSEFKNSTAASLHPVTKRDGTIKFAACASVWLADPNRLDAETLTFRAGASVMTVSPAHGKTALNLWIPAVRGDVPSDWEARASLFVDHVNWLWGEYSEAFLDWLAHIQQMPGELPHFGWVHISRIHGKGRNWISGVLARMWRGNVAASFDLLGALDGKFNDRLSRCLLAVVDEINEGGCSSWHHAQALRQMVTAEHREINPKYGRRHVEFNSTRWLLFSNHTGALPLGAEDRRFWVVDHDEPVMSPSYYKELYGAFHCPSFIPCVARFLSERDISNFDVGMRPPVTKAKAALLSLAQSESDATLAELVQRWPVDVISWAELGRVLPDDEVKYSSLKHPLDRAGMKKVRKIRTAQKTESVYSLRNHEEWAQATPTQIKTEIGRVDFGEKETALIAEEDLATG